MIEQAQVTDPEQPTITSPMSQGLQNLAQAVRGLAATPPEEQGSAHAPDSAPAPEEARTPLPNDVRLEEAIMANKRLEAVAEELSLQLHELIRDRRSLHLKFLGAITLSAALTIWGVAAAVLLMSS